MERKQWEFVETDDNISKVDGEVRVVRTLIALLVVGMVVVLVNKKRTRYTLHVEINPEDAAEISEIFYTKVHKSTWAEFTVDIKDGYVLSQWTGTLPRLEGYDPARWYNSRTNEVRLEIDQNERLTLHFEKL